MKIYYINCLKQMDGEQFLKAFSYMDTMLQERLLKYKFWQDAQRSLYGRLLLRYAMKEYYGFKFKSLTMEKNKFGKPFISGESEFHFNISHSGEWVVCAVSNALIGIDIEEISNLSLPIANGFFSDEEINYLNTLEIKQRIAGFYDIWTLKEAYVKALGTGLSMPSSQFSVVKTALGFEVKSNQDADFYFHQYEIDTKYKLSVCSKTNNFCSNLTKMELDILLI